MIEFDKSLPGLKEMRDAAEHIDDYAVDEGRIKAIKKSGLEVKLIEGTKYEWLGYELDINKALKSSEILFEAIRLNHPSRPRTS